MDMTSRVPDWLTPVAWTYLAASLLSAGYLAVVLLRRGRRGHPATALVWVTAALYLGPAAVVLHHRYGGRDDADRPRGLGGLPGGGASALAHLVGVPLVVASGVTIAGIDLWVMILTIGVLAIALLFAYERVVTRGGSTPAVAATAAVATVLAFDVGMGGWMVLLHYNAFMPPATAGTFWFLMQLGILLGLVTAYPAVAWLHRRGSAAVAV
ncbi:DUF4396 domain-containing protein [Marmoricola sp. Leaf446]|uniref:DUF4396 domain-containing protein n=1 Tax=Marmoricola sp. Leaf446 TaxID=1736379 RepID=UPI0009E800C0|nr:DUF4396 domain-containing protein [Marmoricola sp. Leaf446]